MRVRAKSVKPRSDCSAASSAVSSTTRRWAGRKMALSQAPAGTRSPKIGAARIVAPRNLISRWWKSHAHDPADDDAGRAASRGGVARVNPADDDAGRAASRGGVARVNPANDDAERSDAGERRGKR